MIINRKSCFFFIYIVTIHWLECSSFEGGTITYKVLESYGSVVSICLSQTYIYTYGEVPCDDAMIGDQSTSLFSNTIDDEQDVTVDCVLYCNSSNGYEPVPVASFCTDYSKALGITVGQRTDIINITDGSYFIVASKSISKHKFISQNKTFRKSTWSINSLINLSIKPNGKYNNPPVSKMISPIKIPVGILQTILIPTIDIDNDQVRCRFGEGSNECRDTCYLDSLPNGTDLLPNCTLLITGDHVGDWYTISIVIEDFINSTSTEPFSSISVQFIVYVHDSGPLWYWLGPLIALLASALIGLVIWYFCYYHPRGVLSTNRIVQQERIIEPPQRSYRVENAFENEQSSNVDNLDNNNQAPTSTTIPISPPINKIKVDTPTSLTKSFMFGIRHT